MRTIIAVGACYLLVAASGKAAPDPDMIPYVGHDLGFWDGTGVVMYAVVVEEPKLSQTQYDTLKLRPLAIIAGEFNPAKESTVEVKAYFRHEYSSLDPRVGMKSSRPPPPPSQSRIVIIIRKQANGYMMPPGRMMFMPNEMALSIVKGDPAGLIDEILRKLRLVYTSPKGNLGPPPSIDGNVKHDGETKNTNP